MAHLDKLRRRDIVATPFKSKAEQQEYTFKAAARFWGVVRRLNWQRVCFTSAHNLLRRAPLTCFISQIIAGVTVLVVGTGVIDALLPHDGPPLLGIEAVS